MAGSAANSMARYAELNRSNSTPNQVRGSRRYDWAGLASYAARLFCERIIPVSTVCDRETKASPDRNRHMRSATSSKVVSGNRSLPIRALLGAAAAGSQKRCRAHLPGTLPNRILDGLDRLRPDSCRDIPITPASIPELWYARPAISAGYSWARTRKLVPNGETSRDLSVSDSNINSFSIPVNHCIQNHYHQPIPPPRGRIRTPVH